MMKIRMLTYNNNNAAQWRNDDDSDIFSSSGVKWRHFRWKHVSVALIKTHIHMFSFCSGLSCRSMHINLFSSVDIKLLTGDVSWWIWSVLVFKCVKCYDSYLLRPTVLRPSRFIHVFILKVSFFSDHSQLHVWNILFLKTWRLFMAVDVSSVKTFHSDMSTKWNKIFFLVTSVSSFTHLSCLTLTFKIWEDKFASTMIFLWWICFLQFDCLVFFFFVSLLFTSCVRSPAA